MDAISNQEAAPDGRAGDQQEQAWAEDQLEQTEKNADIVVLSCCNNDTSHCLIVPLSSQEAAEGYSRQDQ